MITTVIIAIVCFAVGGGLSYMLFRYGLKSKYDIIIKEAQTEAEVIKKNKLLEVKEKFLNKKADLEKEVALRNQKIQQAENKLKQRELMLNQKQEEVPSLVTRERCRLEPPVFDLTNIGYCRSGFQFGPGWRGRNTPSGMFRPASRKICRAAALCRARKEPAGPAP